MSDLKKHRISKRMVDGLSVHGKSVVYWDRDLPGFGVRVYRSGRKTYVVQSRGPKGSRRVTIGRHGEVTAQQARKEAAGIIDRIKAGEAPRAESAEPVAEPTVADLAQRYLRTHVAVECKPASERSYRGSLVLILPVLGDMPVGSVAREHVASLHLAMRDTPVAANMALWVLSKMFSLAEAWGLRAPGRNPCRSVRRYKTPRRDRFLSREEYRRIGRVLQRAEAERSAWPPAVAAIRMLMLTGCRSKEVATLRWDDVDFGAGKLRLRDSKTGPRMVALTPTAVQVLEGIPRVDGNPWVFAGRLKGSHVSELGGHWHGLRVRADLSDVRLHDLRHSYASRALALGESLSMIGKLLGHSKVETTGRYAHLARDTEKVSAERIAGSIEDDIRPDVVGASAPVPQRGTAAA